MNNVVSGTWNLEIPGWDSLHGKKDENGRPQGGHIYQVRPLACSVPSKDFQHCRLPKILNVDTLGPKKGRINGDYQLGESYEGRPAWYFPCSDGANLILCHKKQKGKPAWLITKKKVLDEGLDGGYALFAQTSGFPPTEITTYEAKFGELGMLIMENGSRINLCRLRRVLEKKRGKINKVCPILKHNNCLRTFKTATTILFTLELFFFKWENGKLIVN